MTEDNSQDNINAEDLNLDDVVGMEPDDLTDTHKTFLEDNKGSLTDDQASKFGFGAEGGGDDESGDEDDSDESGDEDDYDPNKVKPGVKKSVGADDLGGGDEDDDDMDPEDKARIEKQIAKGNKGILARQQFMEDSQSVNSIISDTPELKPFKGLALKYMKTHPTLTAQDAMAIASSGSQQKIGAQKEREAAEKARKTQSGGSSARPSSGGAKDWGKASFADTEAQIARAKGQR